MNRGRTTATLLLAALLTGALAVPCSAQFSRVESTGDRYIPPTTADSLFLNGDFEGALRALDRTLKRSDTVTAAQLYNRGMAERLTGRGDGLEWFKRAFDAQPGYYLVPWAVGLALTERGRLQEGEQYLREAVRLDKAYYESSVDLARNLREQGRLDEALKAVDRAFGRDRTYVFAYLEKAEILRTMGEWEHTLETLMEGYEKYPYAEILVELVRYHRTAGNRGGILHYGTEYLHTYPKGPRRKEILGAMHAAAPDSQFTAPEQYTHEVYPGGEPWGDPDEVMPDGLRLEYNVHWGLIKVGELKVDVRRGEFLGEPAWRVRYIASSAKGLPFVSIHDTLHAVIDHDIRFTHRIEQYNHEQGFHEIEIYRTDYETGLFESFNYYGNGFWIHASHPVPPGTFDSTSQLWFAQQLVIGQTGGVASVEVSSGFEKTIIRNHGFDEVRSLGGREWRTVNLDGIMHYSGIAGLTGEFQGWYQQPPPSWPLMAKFKIFLGWVTIKYDSYGPTPLPPGPRFTNPVRSASQQGEIATE